MENLTVQEKKCLAFTERMANMAYKKIEKADKETFDILWKAYKGKYLIDAYNIFFKEHKTKSLKINLCETNALNIFSIIAYIAHQIEREEYESTRLEMKNLYISIKMKSDELLIIELFIHKDKLAITVLAEAN